MLTFASLIRGHLCEAKNHFLGFAAGWAGECQIHSTRRRCRRSIYFLEYNVLEMASMDIESQSLTTCEVAPDGSTVVLGFTDSSGTPARIRLPLNQIGALAMTLPELINKELQSRYGDQ